MISPQIIELEQKLRDCSLEDKQWLLEQLHKHLEGLRELHKKDDPIVKWFDKGFPQTTLANGEVA